MYNLRYHLQQNQMEKIIYQFSFILNQSLKSSHSLLRNPAPRRIKDGGITISWQSITEASGISETNRLCITWAWSWNAKGVLRQAFQAIPGRNLHSGFRD